MSTMITSGSNAQIKRIRKLKKNARYRRQEGCFLAEGFKMTEEALQYGEVQCIYVSENAEDEYEERLSHKIGERQTERVSASVFHEITDTETPQGVLSVVRMPEYDKKALVEDSDVSLVFLEDIQNPGNLGTIFRTAEGAGMTAIVLSGGCVDVFNPKVVRATMGAIYRMPFYVASELPEEISRLREKGVTIYAASLDASREYTSCSYDGSVGIVIGNEANGIRKDTQELVDERILIPMDGAVESLNAAVSAALLMYEIRRHR